MARNDEILFVLEMIDARTARFIAVVYQQRSIIRGENETQEPGQKAAHSTGTDIPERERSGDLGTLIRAIDLLLENQPPKTRMVLLTREDSALPLALRRVRGQMVELRQEYMRFKPPEVVAFLRQCMDLHLLANQACVLGTNTDGWIARL